MALSLSNNEQHIYTVSELTLDIKAILEDKFCFVWISAEISNFKCPASGHYYFSLKDRNAHINAVMFKGQHKNLRFVPKDGMSIIGMGRISVYEPRGTYQIILEYLEPKGVGELQVAFEQLKQKLYDEGLFKPDLKQPLPFLPDKISIITSPTGAVIKDIIHIVNRRYPGMALEILPVSVQGKNAEKEIEQAIETLNSRKGSQLAIMARGGGSLEDLNAFNSEKVARTIFKSNVPIVSAIGHETDFTIADFVSDLRAPTPSAAAELCTPVKAQLTDTINSLQNRLKHQLKQVLLLYRNTLARLDDKIVHPKHKIQDQRLKTDDLTARIIRSIKIQMDEKRHKALLSRGQILFNAPTIKTNRLKSKLEQYRANLLFNYNNTIARYRYKQKELISRLSALDPESILSRGYSITRTLPQYKIVKDSVPIKIGQKLEIQLARGQVWVDVVKKK